MNGNIVALVRGWLWWFRRRWDAGATPLIAIGISPIVSFTILLCRHLLRGFALGAVRR